MARHPMFTGAPLLFFCDRATMMLKGGDTMGREEQLNRILTRFDQAAQRFCDDTSGIFCEISSVYKGTGASRHLRYRFAKIYYHSFSVTFVYTAHAILHTVNSILSCAVSVEKHEHAAAIPLPLITDYCDKDVAAPLYIPFITNEEGMQQAFDCIGRVLRGLLPELADISLDPMRKTALLAAFSKDMTDVLDIDDWEQTQADLPAYLIDFFVLRFCSDAFINHLKGNFARSHKQLSNVKKRTGYEERMLAFWASDAPADDADLSAILINAASYNESGVPKADAREFGALFLSWVLLTPLVAAVYSGLYFLLVYLEGRESVYVMGAIENFPFCIVFAFITAIALSYFTRFTFCRWFFGKRFDRYREMDYIQNGRSADKAMKRLLVFLAIVSMIGIVLMAKWNLNFLPDGFVDNSRFFSLRGEYHAYSEIEKVYYKPDRVNGLNQTIDFPSYVLVLRDGTEIDFYEHGEIDDYETELLTYLRDWGVTVER